MQRFRWLIVLALATLGGVRCSETPSSPGTPPSGEAPQPSSPGTPPPGQAPQPENTMPALIVSEALSPAGAEASAGSAVPVAFVSLPPGTLANVASVRIRNLTTGGGATTSMPIVDGGFDPVAVPASAGDRLALSFTDGNGGVTEEYATVPARRLPVVVRTAPTQGRTDVALLVRPVVVFSEPIDPATLPVGMRLVTGGTLVSGRVGLLPEQPWIAEFVPSQSLEPGTTYEMEITQDVHDVMGTAVGVPVTAVFTTASQPPAPPPTISGLLALTRGTDIHVVDVSGGSGRAITSDGVLDPLDAYDTHAEWSPDGTRIAYTRYARDLMAAIYVINADGTNPRRLSPDGTYDAGPTWSPDGRRIAFENRRDDVSNGEIYVMNADGTNRVRLTTYRQPDASPAWSPDGERIAYASYSEVGNGDIYLMNVDGTRRVNLTNDVPDDTEPSWSPDGTQIVFSRHGDLFIVNADGTGLTPLTTGLLGAASPTWAPDGLTIAFSRYVDCGDPWNCPGPFLWAVRVSDGLVWQLPAAGENAIDPSWRR